ncbi:hypothetical protein RND81_05G101900 [Saponaria officinalis]|uniref:EF-hand domain-containing protein n=1 Tax=Saponaria officinalis TaxID=3572 RepID=A0AAW1KZP0_SAPOF
MPKAVVVYAILATAFLLLLSLFCHPHNYPQESRHIRIGRRLTGFGPHFDPFVSKIEHKFEDKGLNVHADGYSKDNPLFKNNNVGRVDEVDKVYFKENGRLNLSMRLTILFPMIDNGPKDGFVGFNELESWIIMQAQEKLDYTTRKLVQAHDKNNDGFISFKDYFPNFSLDDLHENSMEYGKAGWWMEQFTNADADQDSFLSFQEFKDFLHPEDSRNNIRVQEWFLRQKIRRMDQNKDGKLGFEEFRDKAYDTFKSYYEFSTGDHYVPSPELQFADLDLNKDRLLTIQELKPIQRFLFPGELDHASYYSTYLIKEVDDNHDGKLSIEEILNHEHKFYNCVYVGDDEDDNYHDEF